MKRQVTVLGAGITGLSLGFYLKERFKDQIDLRIIEKSNRPGGWIQTLKEGNFTFERGPRTLRVRGNGKHTLDLIEKIGLKDQVVRSKKEASIRYIYREGVLEKVPTTLGEILKSPLIKGKKRDLLWGLLKRGGEREDESIYSFAKRRFSHEVAEEIFSTLTLGIFAGNIKHLSLKHCFPDLYRLEQQRLPFLLSLFLEKRPKSKGGLFTLKGGLETLPQKLAEHLHDYISYNTTEVPQGTDYLFSTIPAIGTIPMESMAILHFGWEKKLLSRQGFGYLVPKGNILGVVFDSEIFPEDSLTTRISLMMRDPNPEEAKEHIRTVLKIEKPPQYFQVSLAKDAIPQYPPGFDQILEQLYAQKTTGHNQVAFIGSSYTGVSVNDCVAAAQKAAYNLDLTV